MKQIWQLLRATLLSVAVAASAQAIPLSTLLAGGALDAGGLAFTGFGTSYSASDPLRVFNAANIDVTALADGSPLGARLRFDVGGNELTVRGDGAFAFAGLQMRFHVATRDPALAVPGALAMSSKPIHMNHGSHGAYVTDFVGDGAIYSGPGEVTNGGWNFPIPAAVTTTGPASVASQAGLWVHKSMLVWATDPAHTVSLVVFSQQFAQELPEPGSLALLAAAGLAAAVLRKRPISGNVR